MNIIHFNKAIETYKKVDLNNTVNAINVKPQDRLMIPKTANEEQIEWIKTRLPPQARYTLFERDPYLVFFFV